MLDSLATAGQVTKAIVQRQVFGVKFIFGDRPRLQRSISLTLNLFNAQYC